MIVQLWCMYKGSRWSSGFSLRRLTVVVSGLPHGMFAPKRIPLRTNLACHANRRRLKPELQQSTCPDFEKSHKMPACISTS